MVILVILLKVYYLISCGEFDDLGPAMVNHHFVVFAVVLKFYVVFVVLKKWTSLLVKMELKLLLPSLHEYQ